MSVKELEKVLTETSWCGGVCPMPAESLQLYYKTGEGPNASWIDFTKATTDELDGLMNTCAPASFGRGGEDVHDPSYRKAGKLDTAQFASTFNLFDSGVLKIVAGELTDDKEDYVRAELYKLNVYSEGGFFKTHKDTPRAKNMIASVVVVFPTSHEGGSLVLRKGKNEFIFESAKYLPSGSSAVGYVAFFSDIDHEVTPVTSGHRITLTYNLYLEEEPQNRIVVPGSVDPKPDDRLRNALVKVLKDPKYDLTQTDNEDLRLLFGLNHQYPLPTSNFSLKKYDFARLLKGSDASLFRTLQALGYTPYFRILYETDYGESYWLAHTPWDESWGNEEMEDDMVDDCMKQIAEYVGHGPEAGNAYYDRDRGATTTVEWITGVEKDKNKNKMEHSYITYGNEASMGCIYGWIVMVVAPSKNALPLPGDSRTSASDEESGSEKVSEQGEPKPAGKNVPKPSSKAKQARMIPTDSSTPRNLCAIEWCKENPGGLRNDFADYWEKIKDTDAAKPFKNASAAAAAEKNAPTGKKAPAKSAAAKKAPAKSAAATKKAPAAGSRNLRSKA